MKPHPVYWGELVVAVVPVHCQEEEAAVAWAVLRTDEKIGEALRKDAAVKGYHMMASLKSTQHHKESLLMLEQSQ